MVSVLFAAAVTILIKWQQVAASSRSSQLKVLRALSTFAYFGHVPDADLPEKDSGAEAD